MKEGEVGCSREEVHTTHSGSWVVWLSQNMSLVTGAPPCGL